VEWPPSRAARRYQSRKGIRLGWLAASTYFTYPALVDVRRTTDAPGSSCSANIEPPLSRTFVIDVPPALRTSYPSGTRRALITLPMYRCDQDRGRRTQRARGSVIRYEHADAGDMDARPHLSCDCVDGPASVIDLARTARTGSPHGGPTTSRSMASNRVRPVAATRSARPVPVVGPLRLHRQAARWRT